MSTIVHPRPALIHPLAGARCGLYLRRYRAHAPYDARSRGSRLVTSAAALVQSAVSAWERLTIDLRFAPHEVPPDPVFVIGHWRSGTTHLHNLLSQSPDFGWLSLGQALMPGHMLSLSARILYGIVRHWIPRKRSFDDVPLGLDLPHEEEIALGNLSPLSYYNCYYYPRDFTGEFRRGVLLEGVTSEEHTQFAAAYRLLAAKLHRKHGGRRLLFKNPPSTARVALLKALFPRARFVHIVRNPVNVFCSSLQRLPAMLSGLAWQPYNHLDLESIVLHCYRELLSNFLANEHRLGSEELVTIRYEDLTANPLREIEYIYGTLQLPGFSQASGAIERYLQRIGEHVARPKSLSSSLIRRVREDWQFAFERWNYPLPDG